MEFLIYVVLGFADGLDAFSVSLSKGVLVKGKPYKYALICATWFGLFQVIMPLIGYYVGSLFWEYIGNYTFCIVAPILLFLGIKVIVDSFKKEEQEAEKKEHSNPFKFGTMLVLSLATSVDAMAAGLTVLGDGGNIFLAVLFIGSITFMMCFVAVLIGKKFGDFAKSKAELVSGILLVLLAIYVLVNGIINLVIALN